MLVVVPYSVSTSNHNPSSDKLIEAQLFLILFLHQTTTVRVLQLIFDKLFLILFLHQTTTAQFVVDYDVRLFLILFLHQTTTNIRLLMLNV